MAYRWTVGFVAALASLLTLGCEYNVKHTTAVSNITRITSRPEPEFAPSACPATGDVAFSGMVWKEKGKRDHFEVWVVNAGKSQHQYQRLTDCEADNYHPAISPDGKRLAYESQRGSMKSAVWETNTSGVGGNRLVTEGSEELSFTYPDVSDDAFVYCALTSKPFLPPAHPVEIDDVGRAILTVLAAPFVAVGVAGEFIVVNVLCGQPVIDTDMIQGKIGRYGYLWICDRDGLNPTEFVEGYTPRWAPKGGANRDKILFSKRDGDGVWHLWTVNRDGSNLTQLTWGSRSDIEPCWSPDGAKIAFASNRTAGGGDVAFGDRCYNIWVMNADGTEMKQLTSYSKFCGHPTFANNEDVYFHAYGGFLIVNWDIWRLTLAK